MNFDLSDLEWTEVDNLVDDTTYFLQAKNVIDGLNFKKLNKVDILLSQDTAEPTGDTEGIIGNSFKFKKVSGINIYVKSLCLPVNIDIQEVQ